MNVSSEHPDFDALSAHHDGEAPEWATHVAGCAACQATLGRLRAISALVGGPVIAAKSAVREEGLARALQAFDNTETDRDATEGAAWDRGEALRPDPVPARAFRPSAAAAGGPGRRPPEPATPIASARSRRGRGTGMWVGVGSAAAVLVAFVFGIGVLTGGNGGGGGETTVAAGGPPAQQRSDASRESAGSALDATGGNSALADTAGGSDGGDLGDIADASALVAGARPGLLQQGGDATTTRSREPVAGITSAAEPELSSEFVGTRPCEMQARAERPDLGTVVYFATGRVQGAPVVVLGFAAAPTDPASPAPVTLLALAQQEGCRVVLDAVGP
jgi:hypothetical protein